MKTTLYLIRHGETEWNKLGRFQGRQNIDLSEAGIMQAQLLRQRLNGSFDAVYCSPLNRASATAEILCSGLPFSPVCVPDLTEIHFGAWEGLTFDEIKQNYPEHFTKWRTDSEIGPMYDGELSIRNASLRAKSCIHDIISKHLNQTILIVSHGGFLKAALIGLFDWRMTMYHQMLFGNTCITTIQFTEELTPVLTGLNDTAHLLGTLSYTI